MLPPQGEPIHDGGAKSWFGERCRPAGERRVGGDGDGVLFLPFGQHLKKQLGASFVVPCNRVRRCRADPLGRSGRSRPPTASWPRPNQFRHGLDGRCRLLHRQEPLATIQIASDPTSYRAPETRLPLRVHFRELTRASENKPCTQPGDGHKPNPEKEGDCSPHTNSPGHGNHIGCSDKAHGNPYQGESESADVQKNERPKSVHTVHSTVGAVLKPRRTE